MPRVGNTPLIGIDAVVLDVETTSLDVRAARVVQMGAVRLDRGRIGRDAAFATLVNPGEPIPPSSTAIHGIDDPTVAGAPGFAAAFKSFLAFAGNAIVVGHTVAFDFAVIAAECRRHGIDHTEPPALDTALLAGVVDPNLLGASLETLAASVGVEVVGRHSAPGDAATTAGIFVALVPALRRRGVQTVGEALSACQEIARAMASAGHATPAPGPPLNEQPARLDPYPFRHRNRDVMSAPPRWIAPATPLGDAVREMRAAGVSSLFVENGTAASAAGIVTEGDVMRAIAADGGGALPRPVGEFASRPLITIGVDDYAYRAVGRMSERRIRHLAVVDRGGEVVGALSARDLLRLRSSEALMLGEAIDMADDPRALAVAWSRLPDVVASLVEEQMAPREIAAIISRETQAMTARAGLLAERRLAQSGGGGPPVPYALVVLGSAGRGESLLAPDQDNAVVFADTDDAAGAATWFAGFGKHVADILDQAGIPYCKGGVMASNREWRNSVSGWHATIAHWLTRSDPQDLLNVDIFFDLLPVHGDQALGEGVWRHAFEAGRGRPEFAKLLAAASADVQSTLTMFGGFRTEEGRIDLKKGGLLPIVANARLLAIQFGVLERATPARLAGVRDLKVGGGADLDRLIAIHGLIVDCVLRQQLQDIADGRRPSNRVDPRRLAPAVQSALKDALRAVRDVEPMVRDVLFQASA
jgi:DNA polymerase-3 subunit epsilon/CBS domain-containing protein